MQKKMTKLPLSWFERADVVQIARELIGKIIRTEWEGLVTTGRITETEAYAGISDKASHAYGGRHTARTKVMYEQAGTSYVYLCYGIHHLFNIVTNKPHIPHAVLIRGLIPLEGVEIQRQRLKKKIQIPTRQLVTGPGLVSKALGITTLHTGILLRREITIWDDGYQPEKILVTPRIGIDYAAEDKELPYRFLLGDV